MRTSIATLFAVCIFPAISIADVPAPKPVVGVSSLPSGEVSKPPPLPQISAHAAGKIDGFHLAHDYGYTQIRTKQVDKKRFFGAKPEAACFNGASTLLYHLKMRAQNAYLRNQPIPEEALDWEAQANAQFTIGGRGGLNKNVLHREELVQKGDQATLETRDAVVTPSGARLIDQRSLPMRKVAEFPVGVTVFAMRTPNTVEFVVHVSPDTNSHSDTILAQSSSSERTLMTSQCQNLRVSVPITKGDGAEWSVAMRVLDKNPDGSAPTPNADGIVERVTRTLRVYLSTSWLSKDPEATISVTGGWHGPSERQRERVSPDDGDR